MVTLKTRPGTNDEEVIEAVLRKNEYQLPETISGQAVVLDIGAHIGAFVNACYARGARRIYAFEPDFSSYRLLLDNTQRLAFSRMSEMLYVAVVGNRMAEVVRMDSAPPTEDGIVDVAGKFVCGGFGTIPTVPFDSVVDWVGASMARGVDILKIDCEGSEWPILYTSKRLHRVQMILGEYHELSDEGYSCRFGVALPNGLHCTREYLLKFLKRANFSIELTFTCEWDDKIGGFKAWR